MANLGMIFSIIGFILLCGGVVLYSYYMYQIVQNKDVLTKDVLRKNGLFCSISLPILIICGIFFILAFFNDQDTASRLEEAGLVLTAGNATMTYLGEIILVISLFAFATSMFSLMYLPKIDKKIKKILKIILIVSIIMVIGFFLMMMQGLSEYLSYPLSNQILFSNGGVTLIYSVGKYSTEGFSFSIALYAIFIICGALLVLYVCDYQIAKKYGVHGLITGCFFVAFPCGLIGARAWYVIGEWYYYASHPAEIIAVWDGGLAIMGGAILGIVAGVTFMIVKYFINPRYKKLDYFLLVDYIVPTILMAQAIGRLGNFFNCEVHGNASDISAWMWLPTFIRNNMHYSSTGPTLGADQIYVPLFFIELLVNLFGYFFIRFGIRNLFGLNKLLKHNYHADGSCAGWYIAWYGATRAILEPMRYSKYNMGSDGNWSVNSAYWMIGIGLAIVVIFIVLKVLTEKDILKLPWNKKEEAEVK